MKQREEKKDLKNVEETEEKVGNFCARGFCNPSTLEEGAPVFQTPEDRSGL